MRYALKTVYIERCPLLAPMTFEPAARTFADYPKYCGPGEGFWEKIIPDWLLFLKVSPACHIHDNCFEWMDGIMGFILANILFLGNLLSIIWHRSCFVLRPFRGVQALLYFVAVSTFGRCVFSKNKGYVFLTVVELGLFVGGVYLLAKAVL